MVLWQMPDSAEWLVIKMIDAWCTVAKHGQLRAMHCGDESNILCELQLVL